MSDGDDEQKDTPILQGAVKAPQNLHVIIEEVMDRIEADHGIGLLLDAQSFEILLPYGKIPQAR